VSILRDSLLEPEDRFKNAGYRLSKSNSVVLEIFAIELGSAWIWVFAIARIIAGFVGVLQSRGSAECGGTERLGAGAPA
jgi:hypothetical protein